MYPISGRAVCDPSNNTLPKVSYAYGFLASSKRYKTLLVIISEEFNVIFLVRSLKYIFLIYVFRYFLFNTRNSYSYETTFHSRSK